MCETSHADTYHWRGVKFWCNLKDRYARAIARRVEFCVCNLAFALKKRVSPAASFSSTIAVFRTFRSRRVLHCRSSSASPILLILGDLTERDTWPRFEMNALPSCPAQIDARASSPEDCAVCFSELARWGGVTTSSKDRCPWSPSRACWLKFTCAARVLEFPWIFFGYLR